MRCRLPVLAAVLFYLCLSLTATRSIDAQVAPMCVGCVPDYGVRVTPDGTNAGTMPANTGGYQAVFNVKNIGSMTDTYDFTCNGNVLTTCTNITPTSATLIGGAQQSVTVTYNVGFSGSGRVQLRAMSPGTDFADNGYYTLTVTGPPPPAAPLVSTAPHNGSYRSVAKCVASCFDATYSHSTPSYVSMGIERSFGLIYNSSTHVPMPVVQLDVDRPPSTAMPTGYSIQLRKTDGTFVTLQNGANIVYFGVPGSFPGRLSAAFSSQANGLGTGAWDLTAVVTAYFASGPLTTNVAVRVLVNDQSKSQFGAGVQMAGLQQIRFLSGTSSVVITEGDGSIAFYYRTSSGSAFTTPAGASDQLVYTGGVYRRYSLDSSYVEFNAAGRMTSSVDRHGNTTTITYAVLDSVPGRITDPMGKYIDLCFGDTSLCYTGKLLRVRVLSNTPGVRESNYLTNAAGQLIRLTDPDGFSDSLSYAPSGLLTTVWDRARQRMDYTFDAMMRVSQIQAPTLTLWNGTSSRPTVTQTSSDFVIWQPGTPGAAQGSPKAVLKGDTVAASISDPLNSATRVRVDRFGGPTRVVDPYGATTAIVRDTEGRATQITTPDGHSVQYWYAGYVIYQAWDNLTGQVTNYTYRPNSNYLLKISGGAVRQDFLYTASNGGAQRALSKVYINSTGAPGTAVGAHLVAWHKPDLRGRDTAVVDSLGFGAHYTYDLSWGSVRTTKDATLQNASTVTYDDMGRAIKSVTPLSGSDTVAYGSMNQVTWSRSGLGLATSYSYEPATLLLSQLTDPKGQINKFSYNPLGALTRQYAVGSLTVADSVGYDVAGRAVRIWRQGPLAIELTYDKVGRPTSRVVPGAPTDYFMYDTVNGRWQVAYNANARDSIYVDLLGRKRTATTWLGGRTFVAKDSINQLGQSTGYAMTYVDSSRTQTISSRYTGAGLADTLCADEQCMWIQRGPNLTTAVVTYDSAANLQKRWSMVQTVDASRRVTSQNFSPLALLPFDAMWPRDSIGRVKSRGPLTGGSAIDFLYDLDGRLTKACDLSQPACALAAPYWTYDAAGNRTESGVTTTYSGANALTRRDIVAFKYDTNGNLVCRYPHGQTCATGQNGRRYTYDGLGRLMEVRNLFESALLASYGYDALGRRVIRRIGPSAAGIELHIHHGNQVVMDIDSITGQRRAEYVWVPGEADRLFAIRTPTWGNGWKLAITDPTIGTIRGIVSASGGAILKQYPEAPWGDATADTGVRVRFRLAGASLEPETGLYHMRARFYDPTLGRFVSEDPIGIAGGANLFAYAGNDPVNNRDPSGTRWKCTKVRVEDWSESYVSEGEIGVISHGHWETRCTGILDEPGGAVGIDNTNAKAEALTALVARQGDRERAWVCARIAAGVLAAGLLDGYKLAPLRIPLQAVGRSVAGAIESGSAYLANILRGGMALQGGLVTSYGRGKAAGIAADATHVAVLAAAQRTIYASSVYTVQTTAESGGDAMDLFLQSPGMAADYAEYCR